MFSIQTNKHVIPLYKADLYIWNQKKKYSR